MPLYEYTCDACGARFEALATTSADTPACPSCGAARVRREISLFATRTGAVASSGCGCGGACACGR